MTEIDASLARLGTDYVDLYQIHRFDDSVPLRRRRRRCMTSSRPQHLFDAIASLTSA